jgi:hypothetical protein
MLSTKEYSIFKYYLNKYKDKLSIEYMLDILIFLKPKYYKKNHKLTNEDIKNIGIILIKIDKIISNIIEINQNEYIKTETIKLFKLIWNDENSRHK